MFANKTLVQLYRVFLPEVTVGERPYLASSFWCTSESSGWFCGAARRALLARGNESLKSCQVLLSEPLVGSDKSAVVSFGEGAAGRDLGSWGSAQSAARPVLAWVFRPV